jgi:hypothetical protein
MTDVYSVLGGKGCKMVGREGFEPSTNGLKDLTGICNLLLLNEKFRVLAATCVPLFMAEYD